jgi:AcrR family transcriptional regulator
MRHDTRRSARENILTAATSLFYERGYQATTIDHILERSGVSRPTLYTHFATKEDLGLAYLRLQRRHDLTLLKDAIRRENTPEIRYLAVIAQVRQLLLASKYRGCRYFNVIAELQASDNNPLVKEARHYVEEFRELIRDVVLELKAAGKRYKGLDADRVTDAYYLLVNGAIMGSQEYQDVWPIDRAIQEIKNLIRK